MHVALWGRVMILHLAVPKPEDKTYFTFGTPGSLSVSLSQCNFTGAVKIVLQFSQNIPYLSEN